jgi:hypothetical protein
MWQLNTLRLIIIEGIVIYYIVRRTIDDANNTVIRIIPALVKIVIVDIYVFAAVNYECRANCVLKMKSFKFDIKTIHYSKRGAACY